jgi:hypothetical protein
MSAFDTISLSSSIEPKTRRLHTVALIPQCSTRRPLASWHATVILRAQYTGQLHNSQLDTVPVVGR